MKEILVCQILLQTLVPAWALAGWPPGGWPPPPPPGPLPDGSVPTLEPQPHADLSYSKRPRNPAAQPFDVEDHWHDNDVYRQFATRFDTKPLDHANLLHPENRAAYEEYIKDHPRHPTYPNSVDRSAESLVIVVLALVGLALILATVIVMDRLQARHISSKNVTFGALSLIFGPWLLLWTWVLLVIVSNADQPTRGHGDQFHWACPLMLAYLGVFLVVHTVNVLIQAYAEWHTLFAKTEGRMGQMFQAIDKAESRHPTWVKPVRMTFFVLDVLIALLGIWLVYFSGPHRDFCQPQIWWTSAAIASVTGAAFLAGAIMYGCWRCVGALAARSSGKDALAFFHVLYHGGQSDIEYQILKEHNHNQPAFMPASDPVVAETPLPFPETKPVKSQPLLPKSTQHVAQKLQHAATQGSLAVPMGSGSLVMQQRPRLQHAQTRF